VTTDHDYRRRTLLEVLAVPKGKEPEEHYPGVIEFILPVGQGAAALTAVMHVDPNDDKVLKLVESFQDWMDAHNKRTDGDLAQMSDLAGHSVSHDFDDDGWSSSSSNFDMGVAWSDVSDDDIPIWDGNVEGIAHSIDESLPQLQVFLDWCSTNEAGQAWLARVFVCLAWAHKTPAMIPNLFTPTRKES
jgi:hypothetical protein